MPKIDPAPFAHSTNLAYRVYHLLDAISDEQTDTVDRNRNERLDALVSIAVDLTLSLARALEANEATVRLGPCREVVS